MTELPDQHSHDCPTCRLSYWCVELECREDVKQVCVDCDPKYSEVVI